MSITRNGELIRKIEDLLDDGKITPEVASMLTLEAVGSLLMEQRETNKAMSVIAGIAKNNANTLKKNPSLIWLLRFKTKETFAVLIPILGVIALTVYVMLESNGFKEYVIGLLQ